MQILCNTAVFTPFFSERCILLSHVVWFIIKKGVFSISNLFKSSAPETLYEQIQKDLRHKINTGVYQDNERIPSENELCKIYNVSRITVTKALSELSLDGYIYRIQGKGSFVTPKDSRPTISSSEKKGSTIKIGLIIPENQDYHSSSLIRAITQTLPFPDYFVETVFSRYPGLEEFALKHFLQQQYQGMIIFPNDFEFYSDIILKMHLEQYPFVLIDRVFNNLPCHSVYCNNEGGSQLAVDHFLKNGHRKIAFVGGAPLKEQVTFSRYTGYIKAVSQKGLRLFFYDNFFNQSGYPNVQEKLVEDILSGHITAALASNSATAIFLYSLCEKHRIRIPQDLSVICFDNPSLFHNTASFFTHIEQQSFQIGQTAAHILQDLIQTGSSSLPTSLMLEPHLVEGSSVKSI